MGKVAFRGSGRQYCKVSLKEGQERMLGACECYPKELQLWSVRGGEPMTLKQQGKVCSRVQITGVRKTTCKGSFLN